MWVSSVSEGRKNRMFIMLSSVICEWNRKGLVNMIVKEIVSYSFSYFFCSVLWCKVVIELCFVLNCICVGGGFGLVVFVW